MHGPDHLVLWGSALITSPWSKARAEAAAAWDLFRVELENVFCRCSTSPPPLHHPSGLSFSSPLLYTPSSFSLPLCPSCPSAPLSHPASLSPSSRPTAPKGIHTGRVYRADHLFNADPPADPELVELAAERHDQDSHQLQNQRDDIQVA